MQPATVDANLAIASERDKWITSRRPERNKVDPAKPYAFFLEHERTRTGEVVPVATIFLTNRECPWKCLMCDLWKNTTTETVAIGAIPSQIDYALSQLPPARQIKLYNSGSFFDRQAIPFEDYAAIARRLDEFDQVIVESHPALINQRVLDFRRMLRGELEVAMGLETVHAEALEKLNKRLTPEQFQQAAAFLHSNGIALRVFILVQPPFVPPHEAVFWAAQSIDFAFDCGATACSLIPTRTGNGALEALAANGHFSEPHLASLEESVAYGIKLRRGRVFADLWDLQRFSRCDVCFGERLLRLRQMNDTQTVSEPIQCSSCQPTST